MPRTIQQAMQDIDLILSWWRHIPTTPVIHAASQADQHHDHDTQGNSHINWRNQ